MAKDVPLSRDPFGLAIVTALYPLTILPISVAAALLIPEERYGVPEDEIDETELMAERITLTSLVAGTLSMLSALYAFFEISWLGFSIPQSWWIGGGIIYVACGLCVWNNFSKPILDEEHYAEKISKT